jgi:hypothetical protein
MPGAPKLTSDQIAWLKALPMSRRAAVVRDHILQHGSITTGKLAELGYNHPPRAARDLKDAGAGVVTTMVTGPDGRRMASYAFSGTANKDGAGRVVIPKVFSDALKDANGYRCAVCGGQFEGRELQADHRVPFAIVGDQPEMIHADFMPLCASDNRAKSWSCEHCDNWTDRNPTMCKSCFWASPDNYLHVAGREERRLNLTFQNADIATYEKLKDQADRAGVSLTVAAKKKLAQ